MSAVSIVPIDIAGIPERQGPTRIRCRQSTLPLEYVGNACDLAVGPYRRNAEPEPSLSKQGCTGLPPWEPHVRFRRVQTLVREGSPLVKLRNSA